MSEPFSLRALGLSAGHAKQETVQIDLQPYVQTAIEYMPAPSVAGTLDINAMIEGLSFGLRFEADFHGPCARCLEPATFRARIDSYEVHDARSPEEEMHCDFVDEVAQVLDVTGWAREAIGLAFPTKVLCRRDCLGLCGVCGENQNEGGLHVHEQALDSRWDALKNLQLQDDETPAAE